MSRIIERKACTVGTVEALPGTAFMEESGADVFVISDLPFEPVSGEGGILAHVLRADNVAVAIDGELDSDGNAVITLVSDCYHVAGRLTVAVYITDEDGNSQCVYACVGNVFRTVGDSELDSGAVIPTLAQLEAAYAACVSATQDAAAVAGSGIATVTETKTYLGID